MNPRLWTEEDVFELKRAYDASAASDSFGEFFERLTESMSISKTLYGVKRRCRMLGLRPKISMPEIACELCQTKIYNKKIKNLLCKKCDQSVRYKLKKERQQIGEKMKAGWSETDVAELRKAYEKEPGRAKSSDFLESLTKSIGGTRSVGAVAEKCRRLGLKPKRIEKLDECTNCSCSLSDNPRIGNVCKKCYQAMYYKSKNKVIECC